MKARVSLAQQNAPEESALLRLPVPLLDRRGAKLILGAQPQDSFPIAPIAPSSRTLFAPRGAALGGACGPLLVCDTGHHRVLIWNSLPAADGAPADIVIGQADFASEGRNRRSVSGPVTFNVPTGIAFERGILAIADAWNHRVLIWHGTPAHSNQQPDIVLGQKDFASNHPNRGADAPGVDTLNWCYGVAIDQGRLLVADTGNRRVLVWENIPAKSGEPADMVLGQRDFTHRDEGAGLERGGLGMQWPHAIAVSHGLLFLADAGSSRVMVWKTLPDENGIACDFVLGQSDFAGRDHNRGAYQPTASTLNMPYGICVAQDMLIVSDTANSRLVGFDLAELGMGVPAARVAGQNGFVQKGENRWVNPSRNSLCWPYGVSASGATVVIADSGNHRVMLWDLS